MSKISKSKIYILGVICILVMCVSGIYAFTNISLLTATTEINTGVVKIDLKEYTINNKGEEVPYDGKQANVLPGQVFSLIPRVSNIGDSCYIRAKVSYTGINNIQISINNKMNENWIRVDDYWYYKQIVKPGENVEIFREFTIPSDITNEFQGKNFEINISAEAVQAKNFTPNFESKSPWNNIVAQKATDGEIKTDKVQVGSSVKVDYENSAEKYIEVPENFFAQLGNVLPGDVISQNIKVKNTSSNECEYFVSVNKPEGVSGKALELLSKLQLAIMNGNEVVYEGNLANANNISLGKYKSNVGSQIEFIVDVPDELANEFANLSSIVSWNFSVKENEPEKVPDKEPDKEPEQKPVPESPQTGETRVIFAIILFIASVIGLVVLFIVDKKLKRRGY